jgi:hypothetical protein
MKTQATQLRVTLPSQLQRYLQVKANKFGLSLSAYVRNLIIDDVKDLEYPIFEASSRTEQSYKEATHDRENAMEMDQFFDSLNNLDKE